MNVKKVFMIMMTDILQSCKTKQSLPLSVEMKSRAVIRVVIAESNIKM